MARSRRSSRSPDCASSASARPRSASSERSWNSSNSTAAIPVSSGSSRIMRAKTPSVTTSMRVRPETLEPSRTRRPTVSPTRSPSSEAMRSAAARAARRRGSSTMIRRSSRQTASRRARGTRVVLPAPGGATRTAFGRASSAPIRSPRTASIGREGKAGGIGGLMARRGAGRKGLGRAAVGIDRLLPNPTSDQMIVRVARRRPGRDGPGARGACGRRAGRRRSSRQTGKEVRARDRVSDPHDHHRAKPDRMVRDHHDRAHLSAGLSTRGPAVLPPAAPHAVGPAVPARRSTGPLRPARAGRATSARCGTVRRRPP